LLPWNFKDESGSAILELVIFGFALQLSVMIAGLNVLAVQKDQITAESIARHSLRSYLLSQTDPESTARELIDESKSKSNLSLNILCEPDCEKPASIVTLEVTLGRAKAAATMVHP
jgi:hypothetical protein